MHLGNNEYKIKPAYNLTLCLDLFGASTSNGTAVGVYGCDVNGINQPNQIWKILPANIGSNGPADWYQIKSKTNTNAGGSAASLSLGGAATPWAITDSTNVASRPGLTSQSYSAAPFQIFRFYQTEIFQVIPFSNSSPWIKTATCPFPYAIDENGEENTLIANTRHEHYGFGSPTITESNNLQKVTVSVDQPVSGSWSASTHVFCNLIHGVGPWRFGGGPAPA